MKWLEHQDILMNTSVEQMIYGENPAAAAQKTVREVRRLESLLSFFIENSEISAINRSAGQAAIKLSDDVMQVLNMAIKYAEMSDGGFDITLAPVIDLWRRCGKQHILPRPSDISYALSISGYHNLRLDRNDKTAFLLKNDCSVDLGAIGKGFAADQCIEIYKSEGVQSAFINLGGNVKTLGYNPKNLAWTIGIQHPDRSRGVYFAAVDIIDQSIVTSGAYERYFEIKGKKYHHIMDNKTGYPCESGLKSVTVICQSSAQADAVSTAAFVLGLDEGLRLISTMDDTDAVFFTDDNKVYITKDLQSRFHLQKDSGLDCYAVN